MRKTLRIESIRLDGGTQVREEDHPEHAKSLAEDIARGDTLPPPLVFDDGDGSLWLSQGFYRRRAAVQAGLEEIECEVKRGSLDDAIWAALPSNRTHGLRRTRADTAKAIRMALKHPNAGTMTQEALASHLRVTRQTIAKYAAEAAAVEGPPALEDDFPPIPPAEAVLPTATKVWQASGLTKSPPTSGETGTDVKFNIPPAKVAPAAADLPPNQEDDDGQEVPAELIPIFEQRTTFSSLVRRLQEIKGEVKALAKTPAGTFLADAEEIIQYGLDESIAAIKAAAPSLIDGTGGFLPKGGEEET